MPLNNYNKIKDILTFDNDDDYYLIRIIRRGKDINNFNDTLMIKTFCISSKKDFEDKLSVIFKLCDNNNARAYINLNKRNYNKTISSMIDYLSNIKDENKKYSLISFDICSNRNHIDNDPKWIIDIDSKNYNIVNDIIENIKKYKPEGNKVKMVLPTKNGYHIICKSFDDKYYNKDYPHYVIHKDQMTILYIPDF